MLDVDRKYTRKHTHMYIYFANANAVFKNLNYILYLNCNVPYIKWKPWMKYDLFNIQNAQRNSLFMPCDVNLTH